MTAMKRYASAALSPNQGALLEGGVDLRVALHEGDGS
jgi:hypothetical protein